MANPKIISRKQMSGETQYTYCPFCFKELNSQGKDYKEFMQPLFEVVTAKWDEAGKRDIITKHYECPRCKKADITVETFLEVYCK
jgi:predicted SprT family Zn-dependent metalloprotease